MNADEPKSFTVTDIRNAVILVNSSTFLSSTPTYAERAALCILCKFLVQGIRAHEIFRDIPTFDSSGMDKIKELYDGLKYSVFNDKDGVFTKESIEHGGTSYDIPPEFLTETAKKEITEDMKKSIKKLVDGLALLFSNRYITTNFNKGTTKDNSIEFQTRPSFGSSRFDRDTKTFSFKANTIPKNMMLGKITTKMENPKVRAWYTNWVKMYNLFFPGDGCGIRVDYRNTTDIKANNVVGKVLQTGGKSRARTRRAMRGSTKCNKQRKQRKQRKQHKTQHKYRKTQHKKHKQHNATRLK